MENEATRTGPGASPRHRSTASSRDTRGAPDKFSSIKMHHVAARARAIHVIRAINPLEPHSRPFVGIRGPPFVHRGFAIGERVHE